MAAHAVTGIRRRLPEATIVWAVQDRCREVLCSPGLVDSVEVSDSQAWRRQRKNVFVGIGRLRRSLALRRFKFDMGFDLHGQLKTSVCLRVSGAKRRIASQAQDPVSLRLNPLMPQPDGKIHEVERSFRCVREFLDIDLPEAPIMPSVGGSERYDVVLQTGGGHPDKVLSGETARALAVGLRDMGHRVCLVGGPGDPDYVIEGVASRVGRDSLLTTCGVVAAAGLHVGPDTGTGHIAAAYGVPTISLFGPTDPCLYRPWSKRAVVLHRGADPNLVDVTEFLERAGEALALRCGS